MPLTELIRYFNEEADTRHGRKGAEMRLVQVSPERVNAQVGEHVVDSAFQPVVDLGKQVVLGHEAYVRATDGDGRHISPNLLFEPYVGKAEMVRLDRLCRTLHALNFLAQRRRAGGYLYLNVHRDHLAAVSTNHGLVFEAVLKRCGLGTEDIVLEIQPEHADLGRLEAWVNNFRSRGYHIAIGGLGRSLPGTEYLVGLRPDIVKVDGYRLTPELREELRPLCKAVVALRLETDNDVATALAAGADLGEGLYFGGPQPDCLLTHHPDGLAAEANPLCELA